MSEPKQAPAHVDFGIDLGTDASCIAKADGDATIVVPNSVDNKNTLTSAVYIKKNGKVLVGNRAKVKAALDFENGCVEFKLRMGSDYVHEFKQTGIKMTPTELSAEILKNLKQSVKDLHDYNLKSAVITVPADFTALQVWETQKAANLAGINQVLLMQEPIAAAIAYGFDSADDDEIWMVYDFGESTFDVSILKRIDGDIVNIANEGDALLGGKLIDWDIVEKTLAPSAIEQFGLDDFSHANPRYGKQFVKMKTAAEGAKKDLCTSDIADIEIEIFVIDEEGDVYDFEDEMGRDELDIIMKPYIERSINHCKNALERAGISKDEISRIVLVGTLALNPYVRERLSEEFNAPLEDSIDPVTVVARGAAVFAGKQPLVWHHPIYDWVDLELVYDYDGADDEFEVCGKLTNPEDSVEGYSIEFVNVKTCYSTGKVRVDSEGYFTTFVFAEMEDEYNLYDIKVYDASGSLVELSEKSPNTLKHRILIENAPVSSQCEENVDDSDLNRLIMEIRYSNDLKEYELGIIDREELDKRRDRHYSAFR